MGKNPLTNERLLLARAELLALPLATTERDVLQRAVEAAVDVTNSTIGYIHYVNPDQNSIELCTWSAGTASFCTATYDRHYPIEEAGIWADSARYKAPQIHNDYGSVPNRRGLPEGHAQLTRHLGVPVTRDDGVHLLMGVGNAGAPYDATDVHAAQLIADTAWDVTLRQREHHHLQNRLQLLTRTHSVIRQAAWEWDPDGNSVLWDTTTEHLIHGFDYPNQTWTPLLEALEPGSAGELEAALKQGAVEPFSLSLRARDDRGHLMPLLMQGYWADRPQGHGRVLRGLLMDVSVLVELDRAHDRATHDAMTGLPNRAWLVQELGERLGTLDRRANDHLAVHFIDFDGFKTVNDQFGHLKGDEVLIACAHRLQALARHPEVVTRYGGDEFVLIQNGPVSPETSKALGLRLRNGLADQPMHLGDEELRLSVSVGVALCERSGLKTEDVLQRADEALYQAKHDPDHVVIVQA